MFQKKGIGTRRPPSNLTRLYFNGSAAKSHSTTTQYRQLSRLVQAKTFITAAEAFSMSSLITVVFKATIGLIVNKGRDKLAEKFDEGDEHYRSEISRHDRP